MIIDLGSHHVRTSVVGLPGELEETPKQLGDNIHQFARTMMRGRYINDLDGVLDIVMHSIDHATLSAGVQPSEVVLGLSGGAIKYCGLTVRIKRPQPDTPITQKELDEILDRIEHETEAKATEKCGVDESWNHLGAIVTDYRLEGQFVTTPIDLTGEKLECIVLHGFWEKEVHKSVDVISNQLGLEINVVWETAVTRALRIREERESFILVDIGGRVTELVLVSGRRVVSNLTVNIGGDDWTDRLAKEFQVNVNQAEKLKRSFQEGVLDQKRTAEAREILEEEVGDYIHMLAAAIRELKVSTDLPAVLYFSGEGANLNVVKSKVLTYPWNKDDLFVNFPHIERVTDSFTNESLYNAYALLS